MTIAILIAFASYRLTRFITRDKIIEPWRSFAQCWFERKWLEQEGHEESDEWQSPVAYLLSCDWCTSIWVAGLVTFITWIAVDVPAPILVWLSASAVAGLLSTWEGRT